MNRIELSPLYRNAVGFDRIASLLDVSSRGDQATNSMPAYDIEVLAENRYEITLAVPGYQRNELDIEVEKHVLSIRGKRAETDESRNFLYKGIATRQFERRFNLAEHIEVVDARLNQGLLTVELVKEIPEAMKPKSIPIQGGEDKAIEHGSESSAAA